MSFGGKGIVLIISVVVAGSVAVCATLLYTSVFRFRTTISESKDIAASMAEKSASASADIPFSSDVVSVTTHSGILTSITYEPPRSISEEDRALLTERIVLPFIEYYMQEASGASIASLVVTKNQSVTRQAVPYIVRVVFPDGTYTSISVKSGIPLWYPE